MSSAVPGRNVFLTRALEKILSEREIKRSQHMQLRKSCESTLSKSTHTHTHTQLGVIVCGGYLSRHYL